MWGGGGAVSDRIIYVEASPSKWINASSWSGFQNYVPFAYSITPLLFAYLFVPWSCSHSVYICGSWGVQYKCLVQVLIFLCFLPLFFFVAFLLFKSEIGSEYPCGTVWTSPLNCYVQFKDVMYYVRSVYLYISTFNAWEYLCVLYHVGKNPFHVAVLLYLWYSTIYLFVTFEVTCVTFYFPPCGGCGATVSVKKRNMLTRE